MTPVEFIIVTFRKTTDFSGDKMQNTYTHIHFVYIYIICVYYIYILYT